MEEPRKIQFPCNGSQNFGSYGIFWCIVWSGVSGLMLSVTSVIRHPCCIVRPVVSVLMISVTAVNHVALCDQGSLG